MRAERIIKAIDVGKKAFIIIIRLSTKGTDGVMKRGAFAVSECLLYLTREELYTTQPVEVSGGAV